MNANVRIGFCVLGFILPSLVGYMVFDIFYSLELILLSIIITIGIYFSTGGELPPSKSSKIEKEIAKEIESLKKMRGRLKP